MLINGELYSINNHGFTHLNENCFIKLDYFYCVDKFSYLQNVVTYTYDCIIQVCSRKTIQTTGVMPSYLPS